MANPRIEIEIGAVTTGLKKGIDGAVISVNQLEERAKKLQQNLKDATDIKSIATYNRRLQDTRDAIDRIKAVGLQSSLQGVGSSARTASNEVNQLTNSTSNYNGVGVEFSRIIQDAPFGIIGVGNNITRLAETFQDLRNKSTSTGAALKTALTSIISPANLLVLGISAVTTALTLWQMGAFDSKEETKSLADAAREAKEELNDYRDSLDGITQARIKGESSAQGEINNFTLLKKQAENANVPLGKRLEAVDELQNKYPDYLGSLTKEQILTGSVGGAYDNLTKSIVATAKARAFSEKISQNSLDLLTIEQQEIDRTAKILEKRAEVERRIANDRSSGAKVAGQITAVDTGLLRAEEELNSLINEQVASVANRNKISAESLRLETEINETYKEGATFTNNTKKNNEANKKTLKEVYNIQRELNFEYLKTSEIQDKIATNSKLIVDNLNEPAKRLAELNKLNATDFSIGFTPIIEVPEIDDSNLSKFIVRLTDFNNQVAGIIENGAQNTLGDFAFSIGDALASGGDVLKSAGSSLLSGLAGVLNQLGQLAIGAGLAIGGIKKALTTLNPVAAIAAGVALVGLAGFVSSKARSLGGGGSGGSAGGGSVGQGVSGQSFSGTGVNNITGQNRDISGELSVRGADLVYVFGQAQNKISKG